MVDVNEVNDDCLIAIFRRLPTRDLINIRNVCQRWRLLSRPLITQIKLNHYILPTYTAEQTLAAATDVLGYCGQYLLKLDISFVAVRYPDNILDVISYYCPTLKTMKLEDMHLSDGSMKELAKRCKTIEVLHFSKISGNFEEEVTLLLKNSTKLTEFAVESIPSFTGACLTSIESEHLQTLNILFCDQFDCKPLASAEKLAKSLKRFSMYAFVSTIPDLKEVCTLKNLNDLNLHATCRELTDQMLVDISENCRSLNRLSFGPFKSSSDVGIEAILNLPLLEWLELRENGGIRREVWGKNRDNLTLKYLSLAYFDLMNMGIINFVKMAPSLQILSLVYCKFKCEHNLTKELCRIVQARDVKVPLLLSISLPSRPSLRFKLQ